MKRKVDIIDLEDDGSNGDKSRMKFMDFFILCYYQQCD